MAEENTQDQDVEVHTPTISSTPTTTLPTKRRRESASAKRDESTLDVAIRVLLHLGAQHLEGADEARPRLVRLDHLVDLAHVGGARRAG